MTMIKFNYTDSYGQPSRGSLAFMPHRRHAANETEILPKPFTVPLLNGEATVNLQPNSSSWVWIITEYFENQAKSFYTTIPDKDGVIQHTELVHISPSSIPAAYDAVEPAWWAEMRQYKQTVGETLLKSTEALSEAQEAIETGRESITATANNASIAKAYSLESRQSSYDAKEYRDQAEQWRDEAQEQADRAATGPESAAARSEAAATRSETARDRAITAEDDARVHAAEARADATTAQNASSTAVTARTEATSQADRAKSEANRAQGYADDLLAGPSEDADRAEAARDAAQGYRDQAEGFSNTAQGYSTTASNYADSAESHASDAADSAQQAQNIVDSLNSEWVTVPASDPWSSTTVVGGGIRYMRQPFGVILTGGVTPNGATENDPICQLPFTVHRSTRHTVAINNEDMRVLGIATDGTVTIYPGQGTINYISLTGIVIPFAEFPE